MILFVERRASGTLQRYRTRFYDRASIPVSQIIRGPAILLQADSTTVVPPKATAVVDESGSIIITLGKHG